MKEEIRGYCDYCESPILMEEEYYQVPGGVLICEDCIDLWVDQFHHYGEIDLTD